MEAAARNALRKLPKVELHAHLFGSFSVSFLKGLQKARRETNRSPWKPIPGRTCSASHFNRDAGDRTAEIRSFVSCTDGGQKDLRSCFSYFDEVRSLVTTRDALVRGAKQVIQDYSDDGTVYLELRSTPKQLRDIDAAEYVDALVEVLEWAKRTLPIEVTLLLSLNREACVNATVLKHCLNFIAESHNRYPEHIVSKSVSKSVSREVGR
eukprot:GHVU01086848.1.p1 GENE.GHVU01086848.1~~GHVU01086848.1.p1  ORF type:complete len:209 (+),score=13.97 GHVU01086848.1:85-711(+)